MKILYFMLLSIITTLSASAIDYDRITIEDNVLKSIFNEERCDKVLNQHYYINCYDNTKKSSTHLYYKLNKEIMNSGNIKERPRFKEDNKVQRKYRITHSDYTNNGRSMDRGHILSNDSMNHNEKAQNSTFLMSNVVPMLDKVNQGRNSWLGIEMHERAMTNKHGTLEVLNYIIYTKKSEKMGKGPNKVLIPEAFVKKMWNKDRNYKECFFVKNKTPDNSKISELRVDCSSLEGL